MGRSGMGCGMSDAVDLSVIICTWNRAASLDATLQSLAGLLPVSAWTWELIVVDNNSTDATRAVAERWTQRLPLRYVFEPKQGHTFARNRGLAETSGGIIAFLDDDVVLEPGWLIALHGAFTRERCDVLQGRVRLRLPRARPAWFSSSCAEWLAQADYGDAPGPLQRYLVGANMACRQSVFHRCGAFNTDLGVNRSGFNDDTEFSKRVRGQGFKEWYEPRAVVWHVIPPERMTQRYFLHRSFRQGKSDAMLNPMPVRGWRRGKMVAYYIRQGCRDRWQAGVMSDGTAFEHGCEAYRKWGYAWALCAS